MSLSVEAVAVAKKYTDNSIKGISGTLAGKNCTIKSIQKVDGVSTITFEWIADDGTVKTSTMNVVDGKDGKDGLNGKDGQQGADGSDGIGISKIEKISTVDLVDTYRITFTDNSTFDYEVTNGKDGQGGGTADVPIEKIKVNGELQTPVNKVVDITVPDAYDDTALVQRISDIESDYAKLSDIPSLNGYATETWVNEQGFLTQHQDLSNYATKDEIPTVPSKVSELTNDSNYQTAEQVNSTVTTEIAKVVADAPEDLNTLKEMSDWIAGHEDDASAMNSAISDNKTAITALQTGKADKSDIPTTVAELTDSADYAKTTEIPTTLPANGGNADTVNNHTVESDVPENAVFTDTIYDDTEVKESIAELNSNLADLEYSENSGSGNIFRGNTKSNPQYVGDFYQQPQTHDYSFDSNSNFNGFIVEVKPNTKYYSIYAFGIISFLDENKTLIGGNEQLFYYDGTGFITTPENCKYVRFSCSKGSTHNYAIFEGDKVREYEQYIPSVKMIAEENEQQNIEAMDLKMLGWSVPKECPIQNEVSGNQFIQRVGRVDLGSLEWTYDTLWKATSGVSTIKNLTINMYHSVYSPTILSISDIPTNSVKKADNGTLWINNGSSTEKPSGYLYFELATEKTINVDGNEAVTKVNDSLSVIGKCKNLLNPTLQTTTQNGVTCTNNGDGTYTLNGTCTKDDAFILKNNIKINGSYRLVGCPKGEYSLWITSGYPEWVIIGEDTGNGSNFTNSSDFLFDVRINIYENKTYNNVVFKPMLTTNLSATYDDFVPYTGDGETLTHDVANLRGSLDKLVTYSTDEQIAGIYLDGKTIYRRRLEIQLDGELQKTLEFIYQGITALEGGEDISIYVNKIEPTVDLSAWNIDTMVKVYGHITDYTDSTRTEKSVDLPYPVTYNSQAYATGWYDYRTKLYVVRVGEQYANKSTAFLTFEYTKI